MEWIEASIFTASQAVEGVCAFLMENGVSSVQIQDDWEMLDFIEKNPFNWDYVDEELTTAEGQVYIKFYLPLTEGEILESIQSGLSGLPERDREMDWGSLILQWEKVDDKEWYDNWKKYYKPFKIGKNIVIKPDWEEYNKNSGEIVFTINPGNLFGTGLHQSTRLCVEQIEKHVNKGDSVIDLGCGTGILSLISLMLGARSAFAADMEPGVVEIVTDNARQNNINLSSVKIRCGNLLMNNALIKEIKENTYDVALVNIVADVIIQLTPLIYDILNEGGIFVTSGIIAERAGDVEAALTAGNFQIEEITRKDEWVCIVSIKNS